MTLRDGPGAGLLSALMTRVAAREAGTTNENSQNAGVLELLLRVHQHELDTVMQEEILQFFEKCVGQLDPESETRLTGTLAGALVTFLARYGRDVASRLAALHARLRPFLHRAWRCSARDPKLKVVNAAG